LIQEGQKKGEIAKKGESGILITGGNKEKLEDLGITPKQSHVFQQIAKIP
jgi:hypothetical protein